jgi:hypothetical protein
MNKRHYYTEAERDYLRKHYPHRPTPEIAEELGLTTSSVWNQANSLGLKKTKECVAEMSRKNMEDPNHPGRKHQFKKGQRVWNKGMKGWHAPGVERTWFKKGNEPHNTKHDGHTRISKDGYIEIRVSKGEYKFLHRVVWERENGPVPDGCIVIFKDGNPVNVRLNNLKMITRAENMKRNTFLNLPPELQELLQTKRVLTRIINNKLNEDE